MERLTKRKEEMFPGATCRIKLCLMEDYLYDTLHIDYDFLMNMEQSFCTDCPMFDIVNKLAEYEDDMEMNCHA